MPINKDEIQAILQSRLERYQPQPLLRNEGKVVAIADDIVTLSGLSYAQQGEVLHLGPEEIPALVMNLEKDFVSAS